MISTDRGPGLLRRIWESYKEALDEGADRTRWIGKRYLSLIAWGKFHAEDDQRAWLDLEDLTLTIEGGDRSEIELGELKRALSYTGALLALLLALFIYQLQFDLLDPAAPTRADLLRYFVTVLLLWIAFQALHVGQELTIEQADRDTGGAD